MLYKNREFITALCILAGALFVIIYVIPNHIEVEQEFELASPSPAFFPKLAAWVIAGLSGLHLANAVARRNKQVDADVDEEWLSAQEERSAYMSALVVIAYFLVLKYVGFLIATALMLATLLVLQDIKKPLRFKMTKSPV